MILSSSLSDSMLIEKISLSTASLISSFVLPTPEKTIFLGSAPATKHLFNSFPETTSNPEPREFKSLRTAIFELDLTAKQTLSLMRMESLYSKKLSLIREAE